MTVADLVNKSTTGDGIPDWEKILFGLDPAKTENVPGVPDSVTIAKLEAQQKAGAVGQANGDNSNAPLSQTDQFSREFFATVTSLTESGAIDQNGNMDQATVDKISSSLENNIQNTPQRKIYTLSDIKITNNESVKTLQKYNDTLNNLFQTNPTKYTILDVLQKFSADPNNVDPTILSELDQNIKQINGFINGMTKTEVPQSLSTLHLNVLNDFEEIYENLNDIELYSSDTVTALGGMTRYQANAPTLVSDVNKLHVAILKKLSN